eukprot:21233-Eustigmatos_ZCMA.PRE.1
MLSELLVPNVVSKNDSRSLLMSYTVILSGGHSDYVHRSREEGGQTCQVRHRTTRTAQGAVQVN